MSIVDVIDHADTTRLLRHPLTAFPETQDIRRVDEDPAGAQRSALAQDVATISVKVDEKNRQLAHGFANGERRTNMKRLAAHCSVDSS